MSYWYTDIDIYLLLNHGAQPDTHVCQAITQDLQQASKQLNDAIKIFNENESIKTALIPINLGYNIEDVFIGSHWTGLVLINNNNNNICALFADPLGKPIKISAPIIYQLLQNYQITLSYNSTIKQQTNNYDCGPITVFNLFCLSRIGKISNIIDDTFIFQQRTLLCKLKETKLTAEEKQIISIPDNYTTEDYFDILDCLPRSHSISQLTDNLITTSQLTDNLITTSQLTDNLITPQLTDNLITPQLTNNNKQVNSISENDKISEEIIFYSLPKSNLIPELTDTTILNSENNNTFYSSKASISNISYKSEIHQKILNARDSYIQSHDKFKMKSTLSLEDDTLDILQSIPHNEITEELTNTNLDSQNRLVEMKRKDIKKLIEMIDVIESCIKNEMQLSATLTKLGNISGGSEKISYNDTDENCIRNKYGYMRRDKGATINHNGIYFEKLYQIKLVLDANNNNDQTNIILDDLHKNSENLKSDLKNIKSIIRSILNNEKEFLPEEHKLIINEFTEPIKKIMDHIINFANIHYYPMILNRIKQEVSKMEIFNIDNRENRYYLARIIAIIGELSREYIQDNSSVNNDDIREMFKHFQKLRDLFLHCHDKIVTGIRDDKERDCTNNNIFYIFHGLNECIENRTLKTDFDYKIINENIRSLKRIFTKPHLKNINQNSNQISKEIPQQIPQEIQQQIPHEIPQQIPHEIPQQIPQEIQQQIPHKIPQQIPQEIPQQISKEIPQQIPPQNDDITNQSNHIGIHNLIYKAYNILSENPKKISKQLANLDRKYQVLVNKISDINDTNYPLALDIDHKQSIQDYIENQIKYSHKNVTTEYQNVNQSISRDSLSEKLQISTNKNDRKSANKCKTEIIKLIKQAQKILSENISESLEKLNEKYQILIRSLNDESSDQYPPRLDETNSIIIDNFIKNLEQAKISRTNMSTKPKENQEEHSLKSDKLIAKIKELVDETEYLIIFEKLNISRDSERTYIIEHIVSVIGQIMRDINDLNSNTNALPTSHIHDSASRSAVSSRNQGLAHDIFAFDKIWLDKQILDNILPAYQHFEAILTISKKDVYETSSITLFSIAFSFLKLGFYDNAVDYFKRTIEYIAKHPDKIHRKNHERINIFQVLFHININTSFEELMGIDIYSFTSRLYLMETYIIACKYDESFKEAEILKKNMQIHRIMEINDESISCFLYDVYNGMVHCLLVQGKNRICIDLLNEIIPISNYPFFKVNLAWAYHFENIPEKAYQLIIDVLPCISDPIDKYTVLYRYVRILSYQLDRKKSITEANKAIKEMEGLFKDNYTLFKKKYDDEFLIMQSHLVKLKVQLLVDKSWLPDNNEKDYKNMIDDLEEYIKKYNDVIKSIKHDLQYDVRISSMYYWICRAYSALVSDKVSTIETEKRKVENAQNYFNKATARLDYFKQTGRISVSSIKEMIKTADYLAFGYNKLASRNDMEEELKDFYMDRAAPYMAMIKRYFQRYQSANVYTPLFSQVKPSFPDKKTIDCDIDNIEKAIVDKFIESKIKLNAKDVNISININKSLKDKLKDYCCSVLLLNQSDIEFENNTCWISLGHKNIEILRKIVDRYQKKK